ncbi:rCG63662, partial [Rattus norvegicus]
MFKTKTEQRSGKINIAYNLPSSPANLGCQVNGVWNCLDVALGGHLESGLINEGKPRLESRSGRVLE